MPEPRLKHLTDKEIREIAEDEIPYALEYLKGASYDARDSAFAELIKFARAVIAAAAPASAAPAPAVVPVAVEALTRLYWWGGMSGSYGYCADVFLGVRDWIDGGMVGSLPPLPAWVADRCPPLLHGGEGEA